MSQLSKLNLLGLVNLSEIVANLKISGQIDQAIIQTATVIEELRNLSQELLKEDENEGYPMSNRPIGIASQNILEEFYQNIVKQQERYTNQNYKQYGFTK